MTIHTFEVGTILTNENFYNIQEQLRESDKDKWKKEKNGMTYFGLSGKGIIIKMYRIKKKGFYTYSITYRISALRVIENNNYVDLFDTRYYGYLEDKVDDMLTDKCELLPILCECKLRRIDFCINAILANQDQVKAYIKIMQRANIPSRLERYTIDDKPTKDDMTLYSDNYMAISIYNKYAQMKKENKKKQIYSDEDMKKAKNLVRMEIRCMDGKVKALKDKYDINSTRDFMAVSDMIGEELFKYYLSKMFNKGAFRRIGNVRTRIEMSEYKSHNKEMLTEFINSALSSANISKVMKYYDKNELKSILSKLDNIDVNYVIPNPMETKYFEDEYIPTPMELYENAKTIMRYLYA